MNRILEYSEIFYHKRFIAEKQTRVNEWVYNKENEYIAIDVDYAE